ncbi:MAG: CHASE2 domain-containing protein [bacterium]|nr:CHASE2 domain-containing protein [bacterium]
MNKYSPYILYLLIAILVVILYVNDFGPMISLQRSLDDLLCRSTAADGTRPNVVLVKIDNQSQDEYGEWPWGHDLIADLTAAVATAEAGAVVLDIDLSENVAQDSAGHTDVLAEQLTWIDQAVLSYDIALAAFRSGKTNNPDFLFNNSMTVDNPLGLMDESSSLLVRKVFAPADKLLRSKPYLGFEYRRPDNDRVLRHEPLVMNYEGYYYPSMSLLAAAVYSGVSTSEIEAIEGKEVRLGKKATIPINEHGEYFVSHYKETSFKRYSAAEVLSPEFDLSLLKGKVVLIGLDKRLSDQIYHTPVDDEATPLSVKASVIENIINDNMVAVRTDLAMINLLILFVLGGFFAFILPRVSLMYRMVILVGGLILLANVNYLLAYSYRMIVPSVYFALEMLLFMIASPMLDWQVLTGKEPEIKKPKVAAKQAKAQSQPEAEVPVREIKASAADATNIKTEAISSRVDETTEVSAMDHQTVNLDKADDDIAKETPSSSTGDVPEPIRPESRQSSDELQPEKPVKSVTDSDAVLIAGEESDSSQELKMMQDAGDLTNLGRYQVTGILGKGAMGTVYKGIDPAINRPVALKTIRLDFVSDPEELAELRERLHREAQAAGKMSHPNIVTIYDVGSEGKLQYIAMECLEGQPLEDLIKKKVRFNYRIIAQIISQICSALEYAHDLGIVHRDIKPANIMVLNDYRIKVMDFGIARVDSNSMTKTGIAMGTPNYISPEQLKGLEIDRRADLFSLGVVMYEMLLGRRPFKGENLTSLMYSILNHEPDKPSTVRPQVPLLFDHIIGRALKKSPNERYQKASEVTADLKDFVESFAH